MSSGARKIVTPTQLCIFKALGVYFQDKSLTLLEFNVLYLATPVRLKSGQK